MQTTSKYSDFNYVYTKYGYKNTIQQITDTISFTGGATTYLQSDWNSFSSWFSIENGVYDGNQHMGWIYKQPLQNYSNHHTEGYLLYKKSFTDPYINFRSSYSYRNESSVTTYSTYTVNNGPYGIRTATSYYTTSNDDGFTMSYVDEQAFYDAYSNNYTYSTESSKIPYNRLSCASRTVIDNSFIVNPLILSDLYNNESDNIRNYTEIDIRCTYDTYYSNITSSYTYSATNYNTISTTTASGSISSTSTYESMFDDDGQYIGHRRVTTSYSRTVNVGTQITRATGYSYDSYGNIVVDDDGDFVYTNMTILPYRCYNIGHFDSIASRYYTTNNSNSTHYTRLSLLWGGKIYRTLRSYTGYYMDVNTLEDMMYIPSYIGTRTITTGFANYVRLA